MKIRNVMLSTENQESKLDSVTSKIYRYTTQVKEKKDLRKIQQNMNDGYLYTDWLKMIFILLFPNNIF